MPRIEVSDKCKSCNDQHATCYHTCPIGEGIAALAGQCESCRHIWACESDPQTCGYWDKGQPPSPAKNDDASNLLGCIDANRDALYQQMNEIECHIDALEDEDREVMFTCPNCGIRHNYGMGYDFLCHSCKESEALKWLATA